ncbi:hypothetical protein GQ54DRAFT_295138 [Martensiomyces pterosporus]|nr:hypothetical protein GQ54DRAFT_295138 [Martensiomyces pterosporus]
MPSGRGGIPSDTLPDGSNMCGPLLLSELAQSSPLATSAILPAPSIPAPGIAAASSGPLPSEAAAASVVAASTAAAPTAAATSTPVPCRYLSGNAAAPTHAAATSSSSALANHAALLGSSSVATAVIQGYAGEVDSGNANGGSRGVGACDSFERPLYVSEVSLDDGEQGPISYNDAMTVAATTSASPPSVLASHDRHAAEQQQQHQQPSADQSAVPMLPLGCGTDDAASGQYQLLNDLLMQCSALDFLNGTAGFGQALQNGGIQPDSHSSLHADLAGLDRQLERQHAEAQSPTILPQLPSSSLETEVSGLSHGLGDISATSSKFAESLFSDNTALANAVAAAYLSANSASDISSSDGSTAAAGSSNSPSTSMGVSQADSSAASAASFLVASTEPMATPLHTAAHDPAGHLSFHASLSELGMLQSKPSRNPVSVASSELPGQRDVMIEQITYPTMPF